MRVEIVLTTSLFHCYTLEGEQNLEPKQFNDADAQAQAGTAGFATVELYLQSLLDRDADRLAIREGVTAYQAGRHRPFDEFDREFQEKHSIAPRT
jgi:hypothetical protein